jgi:hypothetical protein
VKTYALQVFIPSSYHGPNDVSQLETMWLGYIPSNLVNTLASEIRAKQSIFYTGTSDPYRQLAAHVNPSFPINTVDGSTNNPPGTGGSGSGGTSSSSNSSKSRQDAIIGVVSAVGGITLLVLAFLIYRGVKRRREIAHRRLSDAPQGYLGEAPVNRDFDQDSVGGQRRRSFYFAEDSLRGFGETRAGGAELEQQALFRSSPELAANLNRRVVMPSAISAPVMRENSLNF